MSLYTWVDDAHFTAWLRSSRVQRVILAEVQAYNAGVIETHYFSSGPFVSKQFETFWPENQQYHPIISGVPSIVHRLPDDLMGRADISWSDLEIINNNGDFDSLLELAWDGREVALYIGDENWRRDDFRVFFKGTVIDIVPKDDSTLAFRLQGLMAHLNRSVHEETITTGPSVGTIRPFAYGDVKNIKPTLIDAATFKYEVSRKRVRDIVQVYDNGIPVAFTKTLVFANIYEGWFTLNATPAGEVTADVIGYPTSNGAATTNFSVPNFMLEMQFIVSAPPISAPVFINSDNLDEMNTEYGGFPYGDGPLIAIHMAGRTNMMEVMSEAMKTIGGFYTFRNDGDLVMGVVQDPDTMDVDHVLLEDDVWEATFKQLSRRLPVKQVRLGYANNWTVQTSGLAGAVTATRKEELAQPYKIVTAGPDSAIALAHPLAESPDVVPTFFVDQADAQLEANRRLALWGVPRGIYEIEVRPQALEFNLGEVVQMTLPRYPFRTGANAVIVGMVQEPLSENVRLELWR